jgi:hypothetical protein
MLTLSPHSGKYFSRLIVPSDIRHFLRRREIMKSLRCGSYRRATLLCATWEGHLAKLFITLRTNHQRMTQEQIEALVQHYLSTTLMECEEARLERGRVPDNELEGTWLALSDLLDGTVTQLADHDYTKVAPTVDELLTSRNLTLAKTSPAYRKLCRSIWSRNSASSRSRWTASTVTTWKKVIPSQHRTDMYPANLLRTCSRQLQRSPKRSRCTWTLRSPG